MLTSRGQPGDAARKNSHLIGGIASCRSASVEPTQEIELAGLRLTACGNQTACRIGLVGVTWQRHKNWQMATLSTGGVAGVLRNCQSFEKQRHKGMFVVEAEWTGACAWFARREALTRARAADGLALPTIQSNRFLRASGSRCADSGLEIGTARKPGHLGRPAMARAGRHGIK